MGEYYPGTGQIIQNAFSNIAGTAYPALSPFQLNFQNAFIQEWSGDVQRQIGNTWLIDIGYVGTRGLHLVQETDPNQPLNLTSTRNASPDVQAATQMACADGRVPLSDPLSFQFCLHAIGGEFHLSCPPGQDRTAILQGDLDSSLLHVLEIDRHRLQPFQ